MENSSVINRSTCGSVWIEDRVTLSREVPLGTVGGRMAGTQTGLTEMMGTRHPRK